MNSFSISQIAQFSGIKPHTIRMWEQRYDALNPVRSEGNTRYYNNNELRRLLNIVSLMEHDYKVSELCRMPDERLFKLISALNKKEIKDERHEYFISQLIAAGMCYEEGYFEKIFSNCLLRFGLKQTYSKIIYPLLKRLGLMWASNKLPPAYEHFISNLIRQKLFTAINSLPPAKLKAEKWLLFLPENEFHEIGLLFANYLIRSSGKEVIYLGNNIPLQTLFAAVEQTNPDNLFLFLVHHDLPENIRDYFNELSNRFREQKIYAAANERLIYEVNAYKEIFWLNSIKELERKL